MHPSGPCRAAFTDVCSLSCFRYDSLTSLYRHKLGPRVIPHFKDCVSVCVDVLRDADAMDTSDDDRPSSTIALNVMQTLLSAIPKFWSNSELLQVINLYLDDPSTELVSFMKALAKKAQLKLLLPLLSDVWTSLSSSRNKVCTSTLSMLACLLNLYVDHTVTDDSLLQLFGTMHSIFSTGNCRSQPSRAFQYLLGCFQCLRLRPRTPGYSEQTYQHTSDLYAHAPSDRGRRDICVPGAGGQT